jgi:hypothetical protein
LILWNGKELYKSSYKASFLILMSIHVVVPTCVRLCVITSITTLRKFFMSSKSMFHFFIIERFFSIVVAEEIA